MFVPEDKMERTKEKIEDVLRKGRKEISIKEVASFCSTMMSLRLALGNIARFRTRSLLQGVDEAQKRWGWEAKIVDVKQIKYLNKLINIIFFF